MQCSTRVCFMVTAWYVLWKASWWEWWVSTGWSYGCMYQLLLSACTIQNIFCWGCYWFQIPALNRGHSRNWCKGGRLSSGNSYQFMLTNSPEPSWRTSFAAFCTKLNQKHRIQLVRKHITMIILCQSVHFVQFKGVVMPPPPRMAPAKANSSHQ